MIKLAKLVSREFIIGQMINNVFTNVYLVQFQADSTSGQVVPKLSPYMHPLDNSLGHIIPADKIITLCDCPAQLTQLYAIKIQAYIEEIKKLETPVSEPVVEEGDKNVTEISEA